MSDFKDDTLTALEQAAREDRDDFRRTSISEAQVYALLAIAQSISDLGSIIRNRGRVL